MSTQLRVQVLAALLFLHCLAAFGFSQSRISVKSNIIDIENGLSHNFVNDIYRDEYGMLWIATKDGLNRFDGHQTEHFNPGNSDIPTNIISSLAGDRNGHVFIMGKNSLFLYDIRREVFSTICGDKVVAMFFSSHLYWANSREILRYDIDSGSSFVLMKLDDHYGDITGFCFDLNGTLFVATSNSQIIKSDRDNNISVVPLPQLSGIQSDDAGNIWAFTFHSGPVCFFPDGTSKTFSLRGSEQIETIAHLQGTRYATGTTRGLFLLDISSGETARIHCHNFTYDSVNSLLCDGKNLFIGTSHSGLLYTSTLPDSVSSDSREEIPTIIRGMASTPDGSVWLAGKSGLAIINSRLSPFESHILLDKRLSSEISGICFDRSSGCCWIATASGWVCRANPAKGEEKWTKVNEYLSSIKPGKDGTLLANTGHSIISIDGNSFVVTVLSEGEFIDFEMDDLGFLWTASSSSIIQADVKHRSNYRRWHYSQIPGMKESNTITTVYQDENGDLWFGSDGAGLFRYDSYEDKYIHYGRSDGLENEYINGISFSGTSRTLFLATNVGLSLMDTKNDTFVNLSPINGFPFHQASMVSSSPDGENVCVYSGRQVRVLSGAELVPEPEKVSYIIKNVFVNNSRLSPSEEGPLFESALVQKQLSLDWKTNSVSFEVYNPSLNPMMDKQFQYKLDGFDNDFKEANGNIVTYTNLNSGKYCLHIESALKDGDSDSFTFIIGAPFWKSPWFMITVLLLALGITVLAFAVFLKIEKMKTSLVLEQKDAEHQRAVLQMKTTFASNITHEFRTPLSLIGNYLEMLMKEPKLSATAMGSVMSAYKSAEQLNKMIDEFIDINRNEDGHFAINLAPTRVEALLCGVYSYYEDYAREKGIAFRLENSCPDIYIMADASQLERSVINLLSNAFKFASGEITLGMKEDGPSIIIEVADDGPGIDKDNLGHIFERYWTDSSKCRCKGTSSEGSGIGLSFVKRVMQMHSGTVSVESRPGNTVFRLTIPKGNPDIGGVSSETVLVQEDAAPTSFSSQLPSGKSFTVLIVEDNVEMLDILCRTFSENLTVLKASNGEEGLEMALKQQPDIIISDVIMPGMYGTAMCSRLKNDRLTCHIPVILISALSAEDKILTGISSGADDYITKPFKTSVLVAKVINILRSRALLQELYAHDVNKTEDSLSKNPLDIKFLKDAVALVEKNLTMEKYDIDRFAEDLCVSRPVLFRKIKALTGMTPNNFILSIKLKKAAAAMVGDPSMNIEEISLQCGFNSSSYFIKCFKKYYSKTPLAYRKSLASK